MIPQPTPTLPEELLLLALDPVRGKPFCRNRFLEYAMAGAVLAELELQGRITGQGGRFQVANPLDPPDPVLAGVLRSLPAPGKGGGSSGESAKRWVRHAGRQVEGLYLNALVERGVLRRETHRFLGLLPYHRHPVVAKDLAALARTRFDAAERAGFPDPGAGPWPPSSRRRASPAPSAPAAAAAARCATWSTTTGRPTRCSATSARTGRTSRGAGGRAAEPSPAGA